MGKLNLTIPYPDINWGWFSSAQGTASIRILLSASGPAGAWLINHEGWSIFQLDMFTNFVVACLAIVPAAVSLVGAFIATSKGALLQKVANFKEVDQVIVNSDTITPAVADPKVTMNGNAVHK